MSRSPVAVIGDPKNSSTLTPPADPPSRPKSPSTNSARAAEPPQRSGPGANSGFDSSRDYFPVARQATATRPPADAPTMAEAIGRMVAADERWYALNDGWVA